MKIEGTFHDFCEGCPFMELDRIGHYRMDGLMALYTCERYELCQRLWDRLQKRITGSVVVEEDEE